MGSNKTEKSIYLLQSILDYFIKVTIQFYSVDIFFFGYFELFI